MEVTHPLSPRANAFSIESLMSGEHPMDTSLLLGLGAAAPGVHSAPPSAYNPVTPVSSCYYDWSQTSYNQRLKGMEGGIVLFVYLLT